MTMLNAVQLVTELKTKATALGLQLTDDGEGRLKGVDEKIRTKWFLGGRKAVYRISLQLAETERIVLLREAVVEKSWGLPPPTVSVEVETVSGWQRSGKRKDVSLGGGGGIDYALVRESLQQTAADAGWQFRLEGRLP
jgi:hypothetical protein